MEIINQDCVSGLKELQSDSIDCIITSPPYKSIDGYSDKLIENCFTECYRVLKPNSLCFVNFGGLVEDKLRGFKVASILENKCLFKLSEVFIWIKGQYKPIQGNRRVNNLFEYIFMFYKGKMPKLDRLAVGTPYKDKNNIKRYAKGKDLRCSGNIWYINYETIKSKSQKLHNDRFPVDLPLRCLKLSGAKSPFVVLDTFMGSGTTGVAAKQLGLDFVGFEINEQHFNTAQKRLSQASYTGYEAKSQRTAN